MMMTDDNDEVDPAIMETAVVVNAAEEATMNYRDVESSVHVAVRVRPLLDWEVASGEENNHNCIQTKPKSSPPTISIGRKQFAFDQVFSSLTTQVELYDAVVRKLVQNCLQGFNATILAYGQTGSGKTHTVFGPSPHCYLDETDADMGIIPRALINLFQNLKKNNKKNNDGEESSYQVQLQFLELYGEEIRDLLNQQPHANNTKLTIRDYEDEPEVLGAVQIPVDSPQQAWQVLSHGLLRRVTGATAMNESSSRSHAILTIILEQQQKQQQSTPSGEADEQQIQTIRSRFHFVDLAGAERQKRTQAQGQRLEEGISINKGLLTLGNVISALGDPRKRGKTHVPYRESKLTRILRGSLGGNHKTYMIACVSPAAANFQESLNCLKYANRAKNIQNKAVVNVDNHTKIIHEYQSRISILASFVLQQQARSENQKEEEEKGECYSMTLLPFPKEILIAWSQSQQNQVNYIASSIPPTPIHRDTLNNKNHVTNGISFATPHREQDKPQQLLHETQLELRKTQDLLRQTQNYHENAEQELARISAAKQLADLQLSVLLESHPNSNHRDDESKENKDDGYTNNTKISRVMEAAFSEKIQDYEKELRELRGALREKETQLHAFQQWEVDRYGLGDFNDNADLISQTELALKSDRERLMNIRVAAIAETETTPLADSVEKEDEEALAMDTSMERWTNKYLGSFDKREKNIKNNDDEEENEEDKLQHGDDDDSPEVDSSFGMRRQRQFQANLEELSRSIASKERTIEKLKQTQKNFVSMREFYEERLKAMEVALAEKEHERSMLLKELEAAKDGSTDELRDRLREKEQHIEALKKRQNDFKNLSAASSRTASEISKLQDEVKHMKKLKVNLSKELQEEKKRHSKEVRYLKKEATQKEREISKLQKVSLRHEMEATKAKQVSKLHLEELAQLKKKIRSQSMARAGLDSVIVGRREARKIGAAKQGFHSIMSAKLDVDALRDYFDQKVADVTRTEALIDALAQESEDYIELETRIKELRNGDLDDDSIDDLEALTLQLQFKHDKIHQLAQRLSKKKISSGEDKAGDLGQNDAFLFDSEFSTLCNGTTPDQSRSTAARVLFGMIVRERRRVNALARTAASLDDKVQAAEQEVEVMKAAMRAHADEHRQEIAEITQRHQEHILSLMGMVEDNAKTKKPESMMPVNSEEQFQKKLVVLANERVAALESQIAELSSEMISYQKQLSQIDELKESFKKKSEECNVLDAARSELHSILRQIREVVTLQKVHESAVSNAAMLEIAALVNEGLHPKVCSPALKQRKKDRHIKKADHEVTKWVRTTTTPRLKRHVELMHSSDSDSAVSEENEPEWANEIMADLALIAEGKVPPSLLESPSILEEASRIERNSVFDRLADPETFTGTQKLNRSKKAPKNAQLMPTTVQQANQSKLGKSVKNDSCLDEKDDSGASPTILSNNSNDSGPSFSDSKVDEKPKSVFERLLSPSSFTGTQKERFHDAQIKRERSIAAAEAADRVLHNILDEKESTTPSDHGGDRTSSGHRFDFSDYASQDVFDRLQKTTTQAAALRVHRDTKAQTYQKAIKESGAGAKNTGRKGISPGNENATTETHANPEYTRLNVFERLTKTTTEAYAKKKKTSDEI